MRRGFIVLSVSSVRNLFSRPANLKVGVPRAFLCVLSVLSVYSVRNYLLVLKRPANLKVGVPRAFLCVLSVYSVRGYLLALERHANLKVGVPRAFPSAASRRKRLVHWGIAGSRWLPRDNL